MKSDTFGFVMVVLGFLLLVGLILFGCFSTSWQLAVLFLGITLLGIWGLLCE